MIERCCGGMDKAQGLCVRDELGAVLCSSNLRFVRWASTLLLFFEPYQKKKYKKSLQPFQKKIWYIFENSYLTLVEHVNI